MKAKKNMYCLRKEKIGEQRTLTDFFSSRLNVQRYSHGLVLVQPISDLWKRNQKAPIKTTCFWNRGENG